MIKLGGWMIKSWEGWITKLGVMDEKLGGMDDEVGRDG